MVFRPERLKDARRALGLTQKQLAERSGTSQAMVSLYETGARVPGDDTVASMAGQLDVPADWLNGRDEMADSGGISPELAAFVSSDMGRKLSLTEADILHLSRIDPFPGDLMAALTVATLRRGLGLDAWTGRRTAQGLVSILLLKGGDVAGYVDVPRNALPRIMRSAGIGSIMVDCDEVDDWSALSEYGDGMLPGDQSGGQESGGR